MSGAKGHIVGRKDQHQVLLYALSTCIWCRRTRQLLEDEDVAFDYVYVDLVEGTEREQVMTEVRQYNSRGSMPTIVVDQEQVIVGYKPERIREVLEL
ncbi:MAG: glutaredoxin family protein [Chloroflexia bacterium]|nr:glutaredoxin family protein [Chloroflexia bacterium]